MGLVFSGDLALLKLTFLVADNQIDFACRQPFQICQGAHLTLRRVKHVEIVCQRQIIGAAQACAQFQAAVAMDINMSCHALVISSNPTVTTSATLPASILERNPHLV
jgi:hypothetical protein